jgi:nematocidal protein AidA
MDDTIDILVVFDAETIVAKYGTNSDPANPVAVDNSLIYMIVASGEAVSGNAGGELNIAAQTEDTIRWREATLGPDFSAILYLFVPTSGGGLISNPVPYLATVTEPLPNPQNPTQPGTQTIQDYFWNSVALSPGSVTYHFNFMIVARNGATQGYYWWDPFITISS